MPKVLTTGELLIDFSPVQIPGYKNLLCPNPGGAPANVAVQLSRLGVSSGFIGKVGRDDFGAQLRACLDENHVSIKNLIVDPAWKTTLAFVQLDASGNRSFTFYRNPGADTQLKPEEIDLSELESCSILHFGSLALTTDPSRTTTLWLVKKAREMGKLISYDPNWRPPLWPSEKEGIEGMKLGLPLCDMLKISDEEIRLITGEQSLQKGVDQLHALGIRLIVVTLGPRGCAYSLGNGLTRQPTFDTKVVDTTGSGDSFWGGLLSRIVKGGFDTQEALARMDEKTLGEYCRFGNGAGSACAAFPGGIPALQDEESILRCMESTPLLETDDADL